MASYKEAMAEYVSEETDFWYPFKLNKCQQDLTQWIGARDKHFVVDFFDSSDNRYIYAKRLYESRVDCFYQILKETFYDEDITDIMKSKSSVVSFGCGPGPEIAAYISYVRNYLNCKYLELNILAIDCLKEWEPFISVIADLDENATVQFQAGTLSNKLLLRMSHSDVCIMSYPHAMNFEDIWANLKRRFTLIIFIDQAKGPLLRKARFHGFEFVNFQFKGNKTFFYYVDPNYNSYEYTDSSDYYESDASPPISPKRKTIMCPRQKHELLSSLNICKELIKIILSCGHFTTIHCFQNDKLMRLTEKCTELVKVECLTKKHEKSVLCGSNNVCQELILLKMNCGHSISVKCNDQHSNSQLCMAQVRKLCKRGFHQKLLPCSSSLECNEIISFYLNCGHEYKMKCYEDEENKRRTTKCINNVEVRQKCGHLLLIKCFENRPNIVEGKTCQEMISKTCETGVHRKIMRCSSMFICEELVKSKLKCGHQIIIKCFENNFSILNSKVCNAIIVKACERNLHKRNQKCYQSKLSENNSFKCNEITSFSLNCGHKYYMKCYEDEELKKRIAKCQESVKVRQECGHFIFIQCFENQQNLVDKKICQEMVSKVCENRVHGKRMRCCDTFICNEVVEGKLNCEHKVLIKCCENNSLILNDLQCRTIIVKKCKRNIHKRKQECSESNICQKKYSIKMDCGCSKIVNCDDYDEHVRDSICQDDCKIKAKQLFILSEDKIDRNQELAQISEICLNVSGGIKCQNLCKMTLECGHICQWKCYLCINGRLHKPCLEKCSKTLKCGHICNDYCHEGDCTNCSKKCFFDKIKKLFQFKRKISVNKQILWTQLLEIRTENESKDLKPLLEKLLYDVRHKRFSDIKKYKKALKTMIQLFDFRDAINFESFPLVLQKYIDEVNLSMLALIKAIIPAKYDVNYDLIKFNDEFQRIKTIMILCKVVKSYDDSNISKIKVDRICELLDTMMGPKNNLNVLEKLLLQINDIIMKDI